MDEPTQARIAHLITQHQAARDEALATANQHHGAVLALQALLTAPPPKEDDGLHPDAQPGAGQ